ncbi:MAG: 4-alpha-glucanotransferase [Microthrixaceae bacterium]
MTTDAWGIDDGWIDTAGRWHAATPETLALVATAVGRDGTPHPPGRGVQIVRPGAAARIATPSRLLLEDGTTVDVVDRLPPDVPLGLHWIEPIDGSPATTLIVSPGRCHLPVDLREWGVTMQVPTTRSRAGWGVGDLADVRAIAHWLAELGAGALALSPLHAPTPTEPLERSPYYPSSRRWRSPLLLRVDEVPGANALDELPALARAARAASARAGATLDRDAVWRSQRAALEHLWRAQSDTVRDALSRWRATQGTALEDWATFCALAEVHGRRWSTWPVALRHPRDPGVIRTREARADLVSFHCWLQWLLEGQLARASSAGVRIIQDLAIGMDPDGADAWALQDLLALDVSVGAPPDDFAPHGQQWGLPPFVPWRVRDLGYRPLAEQYRASMASGGGVRVDHVMGLDRLFWIPRGRSPSEGTYVRFPAHELLEVLALESARAGALVVGEDLGTVEVGLRDALRDAGVLSTRLVWFEDEPPDRYPIQSVAMITTHDLPTLTGMVSGADEAELISLGRPTPAADRVALQQRLERLVGTTEGSPPGPLIDAAHRRLGESPSALALATLEDLCEVHRRPNVPGTTDERANWSVPLPMSVEELLASPVVAAHVAGLAAGRAD